MSATSVQTSESASQAKDRATVPSSAPAASSSSSRKRICIIGAGSAGSSCAYALSQHPEKFEVTVFDKQDVPGGMATSFNVDEKKYGASYINDGVQGCSPAFANTLKMFDILGFKGTDVGMQISFNKGDTFWSNVFPSPLIKEHSDNIKKFGRVLKIIGTFEVFFAFIPVHVMLKMFRFPDDFGKRLVFPLVALFFGTGNQTPFISSAILERVFLDPNMRLFEFGSERLLEGRPTMMGFPKLEALYETWKALNEKSGNVTYRLGCEVTSIVQRKSAKKGGVVIEYKEGSGDSESTATAVFDELVMACDADTALKLLKANKQSTWRERQVLGSVKYLWDVTITHDDREYMEKHYETSFKPVLYTSTSDSQGESSEDIDSRKFAETEFRPLYYTKQYEKDLNKIEMSFDLTHYQPQFRGVAPTGPRPNSSSGPPESSIPSPNEVPHIYQTIFLDRDSSSQLWTIDEIRQEHRLLEKWWKQQSHAWTHYAKVVPWMWALNGKEHTIYAGAWTLLNMHEIGMVSGFGAAYRLGASFPFKGDKECERLFKLYYALAHAGRVRKEDRSGFFA